MKKKLFIACLLMLISSISLFSEIRIVTTDEPPTNYTLNGEITGTTTDIVKKMLSHEGVNVSIENKPWARSYNIAVNDPNVMIFTAGKTQERITLGFNFIGPVITRKFALYSKSDSNIIINSVDDIKNQKLVVGGMRGDWRTEFFKKEGVKVEEVGNHEANLKKLIAGRIDLWISSDIEAPSNMSAINASMSDIKLAYVFKESSSYIMLSPKTSKDVVVRWEKAFDSVTSDMGDLTMKWSKNLGFSLGFSKDTGYYVK